MKEPAARKSKARILIVDDHPIVREHLAQLICQSDDLTVCGAADDVPSGMAAARKLRPDLVIVDISLKTAHGTELIKQIKGELPQLPVLVLSMHDELVFVERSLRAGARGYITKQEATSNVMTAIRRILDGRIYLSDSMAAGLLGRIVDGQFVEIDSGVSRLSDRELQVFQRIGEGVGTRRIAEEMHLSVKTVETHYARIKYKLGLKDSNELLQQAIQWARSQLNK